MAVHMLGNPCNIEKLEAIARKKGLILIEDAAQAFGAMWRGKRVGTIGRIGIYSFNIFKTINAGDGGMVVTNEDELYFRAFGYHDQGHFPSRSGVEVGNRSIIGQNFRMNEITGAVLIAQFRRLNDIIERLRYIKGRMKKQLEGVPGLTFRRINDPGECNTLLTTFLPTKEAAEKAATRLGTVTMNKSGWHVYNNMEQIIGKKMITEHGCPYNCTCYPCQQEYRKGMLPRTDRLLERAINISVGVVDKGLGSAFGIHPHSTDAEIDQRAAEFIAAVKSVV
jgi:8-amino-3,8-dideoxy-alpha-D-manno-octulosonate transaminase